MEARRGEKGGVMGGEGGVGDAGAARAGIAPRGRETEVVVATRKQGDNKEGRTREGVLGRTQKPAKNH